MHIDYVGHGDVTIRLLEADPEWNWEPKAEDEHGLPVFDTNARGEPVGLWIKLTACGVTRLGYGSVPDGQFDAVKVLIGDALRNAAMRFGVALDLWAKGDRADPTAENATASSGTAVRRTGKRENPFDTPLDDGPPKRAERLRGTPPDDQWQTPKPIAPRQAPPGTTDVPLPDGVWQAPVTDQEWLTAVNSKIQAWNTQDEGNKVWAGVVDQKNAGKLAPADFAKLRAAFPGPVPLAERKRARRRGRKAPKETRRTRRGRGGER